MNSFYLKTNRTFTHLRKYAWLFILLVAIGGLWYPKLGLLMIPIMITLIVMGLLRGKYWCGNICPHGSLFDLIILPISFNRKIPQAFSSILIRGLAFGWFCYMLIQRLIKVFQTWETITFWDQLGYIFVTNYFVVTILGTSLAILINPRAWCTFCPMGTMENLMYKLGKALNITQHTDKLITISDPKICRACGKCAQVCPIQLTPHLEFSAENQFNSEACIKCSTCVKHCPMKILSLQPVKKKVG